MKSSNHIEAFFEYATMGILVTNSSGKITAINPFALKEFGFTEKELNELKSRFVSMASHEFRIPTQRKVFDKFCL